MRLKRLWAQDAAWADTRHVLGAWDAQSADQEALAETMDRLLARRNLSAADVADVAECVRLAWRIGSAR